MLKVILWNAESIKVCIYPLGSWGPDTLGIGMGSLRWKDRAAPWRVRETFRVFPAEPKPRWFSWRDSPHPSGVVLPMPPAARMSPGVEVSEPYGVSRSRRPPQPGGGQPEGKDLQGRDTGNYSGRESVWVWEVYVRVDGFPVPDGLALWKAVRCGVRGAGGNLARPPCGRAGQAGLHSALCPAAVRQGSRQRPFG